MRREVASALGSFRTETTSVVPALIEALQDPDAQVRGWAADHLYWVGVEAKPAAVPALIDALKDPEAEVRRKAASALGHIAREAKASSAWGGFGAEAKDGVSALIDALKDPEAEVRGRAAEALGNIGAEARAAVPALIDALKDMERFPINWSSDRTVSNWASVALSRIDPEAARKASIP